MPFALIDVFSTKPLGGNPLAVVLGGEALGTETMAKLSREFNQSETTFVLPSDQGATIRLRSFTASGFEVGGVGHNALGAWLWLAMTGRLGSIEDMASFTQEIGGGVLPLDVRVEDGRHYVTMEQGPLEVGRTTDRLADVASGLGVAADDLIAPAVAALTGTMHLFVEAASAGVIDAAAPDATELLPVLRSLGAQGLYLYWRNSQAGGYRARFFNPTAGLWEDPATGSAAGPLVALERRRGTVDGEAMVAVRQGEAMGRPSDIRVRAGDPVALRGTGTIVLEGHVQLPESQARRTRLSAPPL